MIRAIVFMLVLGCLATAPCRAADDDFGFISTTIEPPTTPGSLQQEQQQQSSSDSNSIGQESLMQQQQQQSDAPLGGLNNGGYNSPFSSQQGPFGNQPFGNGPFGSQPFQNGPFGNGPFGNQPFGQGPQFGQRGPPCPFRRMFGMSQGFNPFNPYQQQQGFGSYGQGFPFQQQPLQGLQGLGGQINDMVQTQLSNALGGNIPRG